MDRISLSPLLLFMQAGYVGKAVMLVLLMASIWCWVLIVESALSLRRLRRALHEAAALELGPLHDSGRRAALRVLPSESTGEKRQRIQEALNRAGRRWLAQAEHGLAPLAIIASVSPFIGLLGTVWGIMTSFIGIAELKETSLAVVAPGIAEALAATAYGLVAAIPASIGYTRLGAGFTSLAQELGDHFEEKAVELVATGEKIDGSFPRAGLTGAERHRPLAEINVTPLVDVMLVLLIIFMITAPMLAAGMKVNLPQARTSQQLEAKDAIVIGVGRDGKIMLGSEDIAREHLAEAVRARLGGDESRIVQLRGDREAAYGEIVAVLDDLAQHGIVKIAILTDRARPEPVRPEPAQPKAAQPVSSTP